MIFRNLPYKIVIAIVLFVVFASCKRNTDGLKTGRIFYNDTDNILWRHQVNTIEDLRKYSKTFKGIELDIVYYTESNTFEVEYGQNPNKNIKLVDYLGSIHNTGELYYWFDLKNLEWEHVDKLMERLDFVLAEYNIKQRVIIESWSMNSLKKLNKNGFYTSYWIPDFPYNGIITDEQQKILDKILENLNDCKHNAISAPYKMLPFIEEYLSDCSVHLWTNGLKTQEDKELIKAIEATPCVKVVLIDYEEPF